MIRIHCTRDEICSVFEMSVTTLNRRLKERGEKNFEALYKKNSAEGKASLRRWQWSCAKKENPTMLIWLGKNELGQNDGQHLMDNEAPPLNISITTAEPVGDVRVTRSSD
jgi:hypothetical protein